MVRRKYTCMNCAFLFFGLHRIFSTKRRNVSVNYVCVFVSEPACSNRLHAVVASCVRKQYIQAYAFWISSMFMQSHGRSVVIFLPARIHRHIKTLASYTVTAHCSNMSGNTKRRKTWSKAIRFIFNLIDLLSTQIMDVFWKLIYTKFPIFKIVLCSERWEKNYREGIGRKDFTQI